MLRRWGRAPGKRKAGEAKDDIQSSNSQLTAYPLVSGVDHLQERGKKLRGRNRECVLVVLTEFRSSTWNYFMCALLALAGKI